MTDIIIRKVPNYGWLPIIMIDGKEQYRGEFRKTAEVALQYAQTMLAALEEVAC